MNVVSMWVRNISGRGALVISMLVLLGICSAAQAQVPAPVYVQSGYAADDPDVTGSWGGQGGAVLGPADGACAAMGALDKVNLLADFGFNLPGDAVITDVAAYVKAGSNGGQNVAVNLASNATIDPPVLLAAGLILSTTDVGKGNCGSTVVSSVSAPPASWGTTSANLLAVVNNAAFGLVFTKVVTSNVKVDAVCLQITYTSATGENIQEACFSEPPPRTNTITVEKTVVGAVPGSDWAFTGESAVGNFTIAAAGGFDVSADLPDDTYTITETTKPGYDVSVACYSGQTLVASGVASVDVAVAGGDLVTCEFINTEIVLPPPPPPPVTRATFAVTKDFSDNNPNATATVSISCDTGLPLQQSKVINEAAGVTFVVESFASGAMDCDVTEATVAGYTASNYTAGGTNGGGTTPGTPETRCIFTDVVDGAAKTCLITNDPTPVAVRVTKDWVIDGEGGDQIDPYYCIDLSCGTSEIIGGFNTTANQIANWTKELYCGTSYGTLDKTYTAHVVPKWDGSTACSVNGEVVADNSVESDNGCKNGALKPVIGGGGTKNACTITNTVFFEGIPTLSQYGMAIMALLMLGVGFVGFRRLV